MTITNASSRTWSYQPLNTAMTFAPVISWCTQRNFFGGCGSSSNRKRQISKAPLESYAQGTNLFKNKWDNVGHIWACPWTQWRHLLRSFPNPASAWSYGFTANSGHSLLDQCMGSSSNETTRFLLITRGSYRWRQDLDRHHLRPKNL